LDDSTATSQTGLAVTIVGKRFENLIKPERRREGKQIGDGFFKATKKSSTG
jgi:hypothetical protein